SAERRGPSANKTAARSATERLHYLTPTLGASSSAATTTFLSGARLRAVPGCPATFFANNCSAERWPQLPPWTASPATGGRAQVAIAIHPAAIGNSPARASQN